MLSAEGLRTTTSASCPLWMTAGSRLRSTGSGPPARRLDCEGTAQPASARQQASAAARGGDGTSRSGRGTAGLGVNRKGIPSP